MPQSASLSRVLDEAADIARAIGQPMSSGHVLLAFFTTRNQAERLLRDRDIDEDRLLALVAPDAKEPRDAIREIVDRAAQVAAGCGAASVDCLHVLVAMTRARDTVAHALLDNTGEKLSLLRTRALTILTGAVPRWLNGRSPARALERERVGAQVSTRPRTRQAAGAREVRAQERPTPPKWSPPLLPPKNRPGRKFAAPPYPAPDAATGQRGPLGGEPSSAPDRRPSSTPPPAARAPEPTDERPSAPPAAFSPPDVDAKDPALPWLLPEESYPWLTSLGRNLSAEAARGDLDRLVGRAREVEELFDILGKRKTNNPCLIGEPGVGKTSVVEGLASRLVSAEAGDKLARKIIVSLDVGALLVGTHLRGSFSEKLRGIKEEVKRSRGRVIVFFDELHTLVGAGSTGDGPQDAASELKSALARGDFPCIGATTHDEFVKHIEPDPALARRFVPVLIREPSPDEAIVMITESLPAYAAHHRVEYDPGAVAQAVYLSTRYIVDRHLPDKAIALLDLAGSRCARSHSRLVTQDVVAELVAERVDLPVERLLASDTEQLLHLEDHLKREIVGHDRQIVRIAEVIRRNAAGFRSQRPKGVFLFVGPTGVGKTETAKALAKVLHGDPAALIRFDLSEFSEAHSVARLVGAPPGYVGHDTGGQLTEAIRRKPGRILLFDEIEKAHRDVLQLLLQVLDDGRLSDGHGRTVGFAETIVIMTSNLGADLARARRRIGFSAEDDRREYESAVLEIARERLSPELWGRIEDRLVFAPLSRDEVIAITRMLVEDSSRRLTRERGIRYSLDESAVEYLLVQAGADLSLGARPMRHVLQRIVEAPIAARILEGRLHADEHVLVSTREGGSLVFLVGDLRESLSQRPAR